MFHAGKQCEIHPILPSSLDPTEAAADHCAAHDFAKTPLINKPPFGDKANHFQGRTVEVNVPVAPRGTIVLTCFPIIGL